MGQIFVPSSIASGRLIGFQTLTGSGNYVPTPGTHTAIVIAIGAGGGAGGVPVSAGGTLATANATAGAGSGSIARKFLNTLAASYAFVCGAFGAGGAAGANNGNNGGTTTFDTLSAPGGIASLTNNAAFGAPGGMPGAGAPIATGGDINQGGNPGSQMTAFAQRASGSGGTSPYGGAGVAVSAAAGVAVAGSNATGFGAGGGGAYSADAANGAAGGNGAPGAILIWEFS